jgi:Tat protein secretion system quality control protein TatD with DNase activity
MLPLSDAHSHLHRCVAAGDAAALCAGLSTVVCCATHEGDWAAVTAACLAAPPGGPTRIVPGYGVHPWWAHTAVAPACAAAPDALVGTIARLRAAVAGGPPGAHVGEIGLDRSPRGLQASGGWAGQEALFAAQLALAGELRVSVSVHCVRAHDDLLRLLSPYATAAPPCTAAGATASPRPLAAAAGSLRGILLHSWSGPPHAAAQLAALFPPGGATRLVFSFQGAIVQPVVDGWLAAAEAAATPAPRAGGNPSLAVPPVIGGDAEGAGGARAAPAPSPAAARHSRSGGAAKGVMALLARLPASQLVFETDAPDQGFGRSAPPTRLLASPAEAAACCSSTEPPPAGRPTSPLQLAAGPPDAAQPPVDEAPLAEHAAFEAACTRLFGGGGPPGGRAGDTHGSGCGGVHEVPPPTHRLPHTPSRVLPVLWAAVLWRLVAAAAAAVPAHPTPLPRRQRHPHTGGAGGGGGGGGGDGGGERADGAEPATVRHGPPASSDRRGGGGGGGGGEEDAGEEPPVEAALMAVRVGGGTQRVAPREARAALEALALAADATLRALFL